MTAETGQNNTGTTQDALTDAQNDTKRLDWIDARCSDYDGWLVLEIPFIEGETIRQTIDAAMAAEEAGKP